MVNWKAEWIWSDETVRVNDFAGFKKEITVRKPVAAAIICVSAHNGFKLFINGRRIGGYVSPAPSHPEKSKYYLTYDITGNLETGTNVISAIALYLGGSGQNYVNGFPGFILQCEMIFDDGTKETVVTDETWDVSDHTPYKSGSAYQQKRRISVVEEYDSRIKWADFFCRGQEKTACKKAVLSQINKENWSLKAQSIPEGFADEEIIPLPVSFQQTGLQIFDAGKIIAGWPRLELKGYRDVTVTARYSENLDSCGRVGHNVANEATDNYLDSYIMSGAEKETWEPDFSYKAFRYVEVTGYPEMIGDGGITIISAHTGLEYTGYFNSSNPLINDIYKACIQTQKNNMVGQLADCTHREQAQYLADSDLQAETLVYNFDARNMLDKVLGDFSDSQLEDGTFPFVFPTNSSNPGFDRKIPEWDLHFCMLLWKVYYYYNDKTALVKYFDACGKMVAYYNGIRANPTGLVPKSIHWHISDWPYSDKEGNSDGPPPHELTDLSSLFNYDIDQDGKYLTVQNCLFYHVLCLMAKMAEVLERKDEQDYYGHNAASLKEAVLKHLYDKEKKVFTDCFGSVRYHQGTNVLAFEYGLVPDEDREELLGFIKSGGMGCKTVLSLDLLKVLFENGEGEYAYKLLNSKEYPGWGYMISCGSKTIWEGFNDENSHCHAWNAYPARLLAEYITGVKPASPGFGEIDIKPFIPEGLSYAEAKVPTANGLIQICWKKKNASLVIDLYIPAQTTARVFIPVDKSEKSIIMESNKRIWENGIFLKDHENVKFIGSEDNTVILLVQSGSYSFILVL